MENRKIVVQTLQKVLDDEYAIAEKYYSILSVINNLGLTKREVELVAYTAVNGTISYANRRAEFCEKYKTTSATISNLICSLKKIGLFIKKSGKIKVNPIIVLDFKKNLNLVIKIVHNDESEEIDIEGSVIEENVNKTSDIREGIESSDNTSV